MEENIEGLVAEVGHHALGQSADAEVTDVFVALGLAHLGRCIVQHVEDGVERIDPFERHHRPIGEATGLVHLPALEQVEKNVEGGWPCGHADGGTGFGERLRDGEAKAAVVSHTGDEGTFSCQVDREHGGVI
jgi:hypothetical protein